jgi:modulator of FtsH protease
MDRSGVSVLSTGTGTYADSTQRVLRNTYALLSVTLLFSAVVAWAVISLDLPRMNPILMLVGYFGILFAVNRLQNSAWGVLAVFGLTGWLGYTMGGILEMYLRLPQGSGLIMQALGLTGLTFVGLSAFVVTTKRDFGFMGNFLALGSIAAFLLSLGSFFFHWSTGSLVASGLFVLISGGMILWQTSAIVNGGERNYISATVTLYVSLYNLFLSLLQLLGVASDD